MLLVGHLTRDSIQTGFAGWKFGNSAKLRTGDGRPRDCPHLLCCLPSYGLEKPWICYLHSQPFLGSLKAVTTWLMSSFVFETILC